MTTPELITDEIVNKVRAYIEAHKPFNEQDCSQQDAYIYHLILAIQDDITRPVYNLLRGCKQDAEAYKRGLECIRGLGGEISAEIADGTLKGDYHKTDFTEFCETKESA